MGAKWIAFKENVRCAGFTQRQLDIIEAAQRSAPELIGDVVFITSIEDGNHSTVSAHYYGGGVDIRTHGNREGAIVDKENLNGTASAWCIRMRKILGRNFQVIYEESNSHIHVEWDLAT